MLTFLHYSLLESYSSPFFPKFRKEWPRHSLGHVTKEDTNTQGAGDLVPCNTLAFAMVDLVLGFKSKV